jgi:general stress protein 26
MSELQLTKEKITELLEQSHERSFQRYHEELRKELWERFQKENNKTKEIKNEAEIVVS